MSTYCISDIHGHNDELNRFIDTLKPDDEVYVLGDVIDKGDEAIKCLLTIMNDSRFHMLLGNHEYMMYCFLTAKKDTLHYFNSRDLWLILNEGKATYEKYLKLSEEERKKILNFIENLPLNYPDVKVNNKHFYLVHAMPNSLDQVTMKDVNYDSDIINGYVWDRFDRFNPPSIKDRVIVVGHTQVIAMSNEIKPYYVSKDIKDAKFIEIDGSLASRLEESRLIALCLDDMSYKLY